LPSLHSYFAAGKLRRSRQTAQPGWLPAIVFFFAIRENLDESHLDTIDESRSVNRVAREKVRPGKIVKIDINIDGIGKLQSLPGIGPALAARIVRLREQSGPFSSHEDLLRVKGIGPKKLAKIKPFLQSLTPLPGQ
jgi:competence ComEA-like helix-hairpin-helix protein